MANGQAGEVYWTVLYRREGDLTWTHDTVLGGKFPLKSEVEPHVAVVLATRQSTDPGYNQEVLAALFCCGLFLPVE